MGKLALTGGTPVVTGPLGSQWPVYDERDERALSDVLQSRSWTRSKFDGEESWAWRFEDEFAAFQDARHGVAVATGSIGMELALKAVGVEPGDEVIIPAATWITVATAVIAVGAAPVFVDIDPGTYNIDAGKVAAAVTPKTRAVMCVHNGGMPADMDACARWLTGTASRSWVTVPTPTAASGGAAASAPSRTPVLSASRAAKLWPWEKAAWCSPIAMNCKNASTASTM